MPVRQAQDLALSPSAFTRFGELLRFLRHRAHLTQRDLSSAVGYNFAQISRLEAGLRLPDPAVVAVAFVPALALDEEPAWAERLVELAEKAQVQRDEDVYAQVPVAATVVDEAGSEVSSPPTVPGRLSSPPPIAHILVTKLFVPRPHPDRVTRPRLLNRLEAALVEPLTVVSAPAGCGKTTLLADWITQKLGRGAAPEQTAPTQRSQPTAPVVSWLALDEGDNDPATFLRYLVAALQVNAPVIGGTTLALLQAPQPPPLPALLRLLFNELAALAHDTLLVLDDYHVITTTTIHEALALLIDYLPPTLHLVLATRADPPLPLARLRAQGQLIELRAADLRFTAAEASRFLRNVMGLSLTDDDIAALETRTEGWIAGLQLAALAMQDRNDRASFINAFTGNNRFVVDYLVAEVVERQPPHLQAFLLQTSILGRLCGPLCDAVMGVGDGGSVHSAYTQVLLEDLERANLFLVPLDDERRWYRYHHLFGEVLRERLRRGTSAADVAQLHRRASAWFAQQNLVEEAPHHALAAGVPEEAAQLIEQRAEQMLIGSEMATLRRWIERLPQELVHSRHRLAQAYAGVLLIAGNVAAVEPLMQAAEHAPSITAFTLERPNAVQRVSDADVGWLDDVANSTRLLRSIAARAAHDLPRAIALGREVLANAPKQFVFVRSSAAWNLGMAYWSSAQLDAASDAFLAVLADNQSSDQVYLYCAATASLGQIRRIQGRLRAAAQIYQQALKHVVEGGGHIPGVGMIHVGLAEVLYEWNELDGATQHLSAGLERAQQFANMDVLASGYLTLARVKQAQRDQVGAAAMFARAEQLTPGAVFSTATPQHARIALARDDVAAAEAWATRNGLSAEADVRYEHETELIILTRVLLAQQQWTVALPLLERLELAAVVGGRTGIVIELLILRVMALHGRGDQRAAFAALAHALSLAAPEGYMRSFLDEGAPLRNLLHAWFRAEVGERAQAGDNQALGRYARRLLAAFPTDLPGIADVTSVVDKRTPQPPVPKVQPATAFPLVEPLSDRELAVLQLVASGLANGEIATRLVVSVSTVKKHINNIFGKLGVQSRTQALVRARDLNLL